MENKQPYRTTSLEESAAIAAGGAEFVGLEARSHRSFYFCFTPADVAADLGQQFRSGSLNVNARLLTDSMTLLKDAIFTRLRNGDRDGYPADQAGR